MTASLFSLNRNSIEFEIHGTKIFNDSVQLDELELKRGEQVTVLIKKVITNLLESSGSKPSTPDGLVKPKFAESVASSEDPSDELAAVNERFLRK